MRHSTIRAGRLLALLLLPVLLGGCGPVGLAVGAGATAGLGSAQERGAGGTASDTLLRARINEAWFRGNVEVLDRIGLSISEGRVLLTGAVADEALRAEAVRLTWQAEGVREVINEIQVVPRRDGSDSARDSWITAQLRTAITMDGQIQSINYSIETVEGVVYLIGIAQSAAEIDRVINHARNIAYVRRVVSHVLTRDDPRRRPA
ncbi:MAG: BON domain-containing protein [Thalassobaculales bacterium]